MPQHPADTGEIERNSEARNLRYRRTGGAEEKISYDPWGQPTVEQAGEADATGNPYLFQGRRLDSETGLYYFRNRYYSPTLGRFLQRDPSEYQDGNEMGLIPNYARDTR